MRLGLTVQQVRRNTQVYLIWVLPLGFYAALWLGLQAGNLGDISRSGSFFDRLDALRAVIPLVAIAGAIAFIAYQWRQRKNVSLLGPLAFTFLYGVVGLFAALNSPSGGTAVYWALAYLSVPLVLCAVVWNSQPLSRAAQVVNLNWMVIGVGVGVLFFFALFKMNLGGLIANPSLLLQCQAAGPWEVETSGILRSTGVGRYAAIAALLTFSMFWWGRRSWILGPVFLGSVILLLSSGARTSMAGFAVGAVILALASAGKRTLIFGAATLALLTVLATATGLHSDFIDGCVNKYFIPVENPAPSTTTAFTGVDIPGGVLAPGNLGPDVAGLPGEIGMSGGFPASSGPIFGPSQPNSAGKITGRTNAWRAGWGLFKKSPLIGYGFHADRIILQAHMHNAVMHSLVQTGILGTVPFVIAVLFGWSMLIKAFLGRNAITVFHRRMLIQTGGILAFLSVRALMESTGAFFGVDWLILAPLLLYIQLVNSSEARSDQLV